MKKYILFVNNEETYFWEDFEKKKAFAKARELGGILMAVIFNEDGTPKEAIKKNFTKYACINILSPTYLYGIILQDHVLCPYTGEVLSKEGSRVTIEDIGKWKHSNIDRVVANSAVWVWPLV